MIDYIIKKENSDFIVNEISVVPFGAGEYQYHILKKSGLKTIDAIDDLCKCNNLKLEEIHYSGLKDEDAVTTQYIAIKDLILENNRVYISEDVWYDVKYIGSSEKKIGIGDLLGNAFDIKIRNLNISEANKVKRFAKHDVRIINYYDIQRFGMPGRVKLTHKIGESLINRDYIRTLELMLKSGNIEELEYNHYKGREESYIRKLNLKKLNFFLSSWDSFNWNTKIHSIIKKSDIPYKSIIREGIEFIYTEINDELLAKLSDLNIIRHSFNCDFEITEKTSYRAPVISSVLNVSDVSEDLNGSYNVSVSFVLPSGSYATAYIDQLMWIAD